MRNAVSVLDLIILRKPLKIQPQRFSRQGYPFPKSAGREFGES